MGSKTYIEWNRWIDIRPGIRLNIYDFAPGEQTGEIDRNGHDATYDFDFALSGKWRLELHYATGEKQCILIKAGNSGLHLLRLSARTFQSKATILSTGNLRGVLISVDSKAMRETAGSLFSLLPPVMERIGMERQHTIVSQFSPILPAMRMAVQQIMVPPLGGSMSRLYLESKAIELVALKMSQYENALPQRSAQRLKPEDIQRIRRARELLIRDITDPPSIPTLARMVGINDQKLKSGFRQVFGDTVYRTLKTVRMEVARKRLNLAEENVLQVANRVGYANPGHFAAAFREHFGVTPGSYLSHQRLANTANRKIR